MHLKELRVWLSKLKNIILDIHICLFNLERLLKIPYKYEYEEDVRNIGFFSFYEYQMYFISIIQLDKIFSNNDNQEYNFHKLCRRLICESYDKEFKDNLRTNQKAINNESTFKSRKDCMDAAMEIAKDIAEKKEIIQKIRDYRDQVYAHSDRNPKLKNINITEIDELAALSEQIYNRLSIGIFNSKTNFEYLEPWNIDIIIKELSESMKYKIEKI